jgi:hypothetical protein
LKFDNTGAQIVPLARELVGAWASSGGSSPIPLAAERARQEQGIN